VKRRLTIAIAVVAALYVALCVAARLAYPRMLFPAPRLDGVPTEFATELARPDGPKLLDLPQPSGGPTRALWLAPREATSRVVVMFHGNGESMFDEYPTAATLASHGLGVVLVEYRGYGLTYGPPPAEDAMYEDGEAALRWLAEKGIARERIVLWGYSLGTGIAAELAKRGRAPRLVLIAPYTSITAMGRRWAPFLPVGLLMSHRFDTLGKAPAIAADALVVHGDHDEVVPFEMGKTVAYALAHGRFLRADGAGHLDVLADPRIFGQVAEFVKR
jgi:pimeloyl-ACP methyl ester carboxylesterase